MKRDDTSTKPTVFSDWQKGGVRYAKLKVVVPEYLAPAEVLAFFVAVRRGSSLRLINPFSPLQREYVIAATTTGVSVLRLRRPGVFRASIGETVAAGVVAPENVAWKDGRMTICGVAYQPISFHGPDAEAVAKLARQSSVSGGESDAA